MTHLKNFFYLLVGLIFIGFCIISFLKQPAPAKYQISSSIEIGERRIEIEIADTDEERKQGLSQRTHLEENQGLLFIFEKPDYYGFWMKEMLFPIDIIWIDENRRVVDIMREIRPETFPHVFYPKLPVLYVLELQNKGSFDIGIDIGDELFFNP